MKITGLMLALFLIVAVFGTYIFLTMVITPDPIIECPYGRDPATNECNTVGTCTPMSVVFLECPRPPTPGSSALEITSRNSTLFGAIVPNVDISLYTPNSAGSLVKSGVTDVNGKLRFDGLNPSQNYTVVATKTGYIKYTAGGLKMTTDQTRLVTVLMKPIVVSGTNNPPPAPTNFAVAVKSSTLVNTTWTPIVGATSYKVYRFTSATSPTYASVTSAACISNPSIACSYLSGGLSPGTTYYFQVSALNAYGEGEKSGVIQVNMPF